MQLPLGHRAAGTGVGSASVAKKRQHRTAQHPSELGVKDAALFLCPWGLGRAAPQDLHPHFWQRDRQLGKSTLDRAQGP